MSHVTNAVLLFSCSEHEHPTRIWPPNGRNHPIVDRLNESLAGYGMDGRFVRLDHLAGGNKAFESSMYASAFNFLIEENLMVALREQSWQDRDSVQLLLQGQHDDRFTMHNVYPG